MSSIFLSHNRKDKQFVRRLGADLQRYGIKVWIDEAEIKVGESLISKIEYAIKEMDYLGVVLSPYSVKSEWVKREVEIALNDEIKGKRVKVLPILAKKCEIPEFLQSKLYADFRRKQDWYSSIALIVRALGLDAEYDDDRVPGKRVMLYEDFIAQIQEYFRPREVEVEFFHDGVFHFIKVHNGDKTFELYDYFTKPTDADILNTIFGNVSGPRIQGVLLMDSSLMTRAEVEQKNKEVVLKYRLPKDSHAYNWREKYDKGQKYKMAYDEWEAWLENKKGVAFLYEN